MGLFTRRKPSSPAPPPLAPALTGAGASSQSRIEAIGRELLDAARRHKAGLLSAKFYQDKLMDWSMKDHEFKVQLFRFVDAFPVLRTPEQVHEHLSDYLSQPGVTLPPGLDLGLRAGALAKGLMTRTISSQIEGMAGSFIAGRDAAGALGTLRTVWNAGIAFSVDLLGEACLSDAEADEYRDKYLDLIETLPSAVAAWPANPVLEADHLGAIPRTNVSIKVSSLSPKDDPIDTAGAIRELRRRIDPILDAASRRGVFINFDMEQHELKDLTLELFMQCAEQHDTPMGLAMQAYLKSGVEDARQLVEWSKRTGRVVSVRLIKGAYWDFETVHAEMMGWPSPVWTEKWQTDLCFERMAEVFLDACPSVGEQGRGAHGRAAKNGVIGGGGIKLALGSHNVRSIAAVLEGLERRGLPREAVELQMLHGMADQLKHAAAGLGLRVREYIPVGEMIPGMAYLVRRLLENTSNESWLKAGFLDNADASVLLAPPGPARGTSVASIGAGPASDRSPTDLASVAAERHALSPAVSGVGDGRAFVNAPMRDFSRCDARDAFAAAVSRARVPAVASDRTPAQASEMVARAASAFEAWRDADPRLRAGVLVRAAAAMRACRDELSAVMVKEAGKTWREADADTCEAIDFCEYYAREAVFLFEPQRLGRFIGELDEVWHQPRGVVVVIAPWNFPLAICTGMTAAALVTGNTVVVKPAEQTPGIARLMFDILRGALEESVSGMPASAPLRLAAADVLHFCPAPGETTGAALVRDPRVAIIAFTGSKGVGLDIVRAAGDTRPEQAQVKRVICEMGGKNAIIIDSSADLDEAVKGVRYSAFGFQGQKCSACSRVVVVDPDGPGGEHTRTFVRRFVEATRALVIGDPTRPGTDVGPVIDAAAAATIRRFVRTAKDEGCTLELELTPPEGDAFVSANGDRVVGPTIFSGVEERHTIAREEVFGPVVAVMHARTFDEALRVANASAYKLTGGVFTRKPEHIARAKREFRVGNLYINRGCTGAIVARQPFGGFGMSGVGSKAGGREYLLQFVEPRACCENTLRSGFAPEL